MKTKKFLSMAALALVGAMMTGCSSDDDNLQPENKNNVVTLTATVGFDDAASTRAVTGTGTKTFAEGDQIVLFYKDGKGISRRVVSSALTPGDITNEGKKANLTFDVSAALPATDGAIRYVYPANMASTNQDSSFDLDDEHTIDFSKLNNQDGTLTTLGSSLDLCVFDGNFSGTNLPASATLTNQLAILAITLKNEAGSSDITGSTTKLTVSDGTNTYNVNRDVAAGPIYVAILPTSGATIDVTATDGSKNYTKSLTNKTYEASKGYNVSWKMTQGANLSKLTDAYTAQNGDKLTGTLGANVQISIAADATVTLDGVNINGTGTWTTGNHAGITCVGNATIILEGANTVKGFYEDYPGIQVPVDKTLTIQGTGSLTASPFDGGGTMNSYGAGIGGGYEFPCGNIVINSGTITATGGYGAAGIGGGQNGFCGTITITSGVTKVTATKGSLATNSIGAGNAGTCGTVTIGGNVGAITTSPYTYQP